VVAKANAAVSGLMIARLRRLGDFLQTSGAATPLAAMDFGELGCMADPREWEGPHKVDNDTPPCIGEMALRLVGVF
jgi:hypothetical protein